VLKGSATSAHDAVAIFTSDMGLSRPSVLFASTLRTTAWNLQNTTKIDMCINILSGKKDHLGIQFWFALLNPTIYSVLESPTSTMSVGAKMSKYLNFSLYKEKVLFMIPTSPF
jgi:hypothetical protein